MRVMGDAAIALAATRAGLTYIEPIASFSASLHPPSEAGADAETGHEVSSHREAALLRLSSKSALFAAPAKLRRRSFLNRRADESSSNIADARTRGGVDVGGMGGSVKTLSEPAAPATVPYLCVGSSARVGFLQ